MTGLEPENREFIATAYFIESVGESDLKLIAVASPLGMRYPSGTQGPLMKLEFVPLMNLTSSAGET